MKNLPSISIVTIVFNGVQHVERAIQSLLNQKYPQLEYIVVDGGSTDGTLEVLERYKDQITHLVSEPDEGISDAFNKGIRLASGQLIGLLNADDQYLPGALNTVAHNFKGRGVYYGNMQLLVGGKREDTYIPDHRLLHRDMTLCHPSSFISSELYAEFGAYDNEYKLAMDYELLLRLLVNEVNFYHIDRTLTLMSTEGVSNQNWKAAFDEVQRARRKHLELGSFDRMHSNYVKWRKTIGHALHESPLRIVTVAYRRWFSLVRKR